MKDLLLLCHRLPYPPNKGDKIRSYHLLKFLAERWRIHLVTFIDDDNDEQYRDALRDVCASIHIQRIKPMSAKLRALSGLLLGGTFTDAFYRFAAVQREVNRLIAQHDIRHAFCYSTPMAQYLNAHEGLHRFMDFVDMDSYKWKQYSQSHKPPMSWVFATEFRRLLAREKRIAEQYDACWFVTPEEQALFERESAQQFQRLGFYRNGVDQQYFDATAAFDTPFPAERRAIVFTGAMDYYANADAVQWFADHVLPALRQQDPALHFYIVGSKPAERVQALAKREGITVTGRVPDVRPYLQHAALAVAPMRIARGLQNKVLEGLSMGKAVVSTPEALEGLQHDPLLDELSAGSRADYIGRCQHFLQTPVPAERCLRYIRAHYDWHGNLQPLQAQMESA